MEQYSFKFLEVHREELEEAISDLVNQAGWRVVSVAPINGKDSVDNGEGVYIVDVVKFFVTLQRRDA